MVRGFALFVGCYLVASRGLAVVGGGDGAVWLYDLRAVPGGAWMLAAAGVMLVGYAVRPGRWWKMGAAALAGLGCVALVNAGVYWHLKMTDGLHAAWWVPLSAVLAVLGGVGAWWVWRHGAGVRDGWWARGRMVAVAGIWAGLVTFGWMGFFGQTDYRRPADAVVVFGAKTYADGRPSDALADRVRTAARLVTSGEAEWLIVSGGPGDGPVHETEAMRDLAIALGVPGERIVLDREGLNTAATVHHAEQIAEERGFNRLIFVSHAYHLPRIKLTADRAGLDAVTVPAEESYTLTAMPWYMTREVAAWWVYWLRV